MTDPTQRTETPRDESATPRDEMRRIHLAVVVEYNHGSILSTDVEVAIELGLARHDTSQGTRLPVAQRTVRAMAVVVSEGLHDELTELVRKP